MMLSQIVSIRDAKTEIFSQPMFFVTKGVAIRAFFDEVARQGSDVSKHPEDFSLFYLGVFDDQSGVFTPVEQPLQLALALDGVKQ